MDQTKCTEGEGQRADKLTFLVNAEIIILKVSCCGLKHEIILYKIVLTLQSHIHTLSTSFPMSTSHGCFKHNTEAGREVTFWHMHCVSNFYWHE